MSVTGDSVLSLYAGRKIFRWALLWTVLFECVTCVLRFGAGLESTRDSAASIGRLTFGLRIHHGYIGVLLLVVAHFALSKKPSLQSRSVILGYALLASDLIHHFCVLWPLVGSPQFDLFYPKV